MAQVTIREKVFFISYIFGIKQIWFCKDRQSDVRFLFSTEWWQTIRQHVWSSRLLAASKCSKLNCRTHMLWEIYALAERSGADLTIDRTKFTVIMRTGKLCSQLWHSDNFSIKTFSDNFCNFKSPFKYSMEYYSWVYVQAQNKYGSVYVFAKVTSHASPYSLLSCYRWYPHKGN